MAASSPTLANSKHESLPRNAANYVPLTPLSFLQRTASVYPERLSIIHGPRRFTWSETYRRCRQLASALQQHGVGVGDTVAVVAPNIPALYEAHFGVAMVGAVLNAVNIRMDARMIAHFLAHGQARVVMVDREFLGVTEDALAHANQTDRSFRPFAVVIDDDTANIMWPPSEPAYCIRRYTEYEELLRQGDADFQWKWPADEWAAISLNYTSGTTSNPKGVVYHHRGAHLNAISNALVWSMMPHPVYLWTLPLFHCNGWCFPWTVALLAGTNVCLRKVTAENIYAAIAQHGVTHFSGAPTVLGMLVNATPREKRPLPHPVAIITAGAAPPPTILSRIEEAGFKVTHVYGLTESYGPAVVCAWKPEWSTLPAAERARLKSRQGVPYPALEGLDVLDPKTLKSVPADGRTVGEVMLRGNVIMKGYLRNEAATREAFEGGWFHSGDLGVKHEDGYVELKDRSKDIIISGGENISSIEVEGILFQHPAVLEAAVVAKPHPKWLETPVAFIALREGSERCTEEEILQWCRREMPRFMCPSRIVFGPLPKTATGKVQKYVLREEAKRMPEAKQSRL